jgi:uncharacterized protein (DUF1015 family)
MAVIKSFRGLRPPKEIVKDLASRPYDVLDSEEARVEVEGNEYSLLHIIKPEVDLPADIDHYSQEVYDMAAANFAKFRDKGWLKEDAEAHLYIYAQTMNGKTQYGLVACASVEDYMNGVILKHELTRPDKEEDRKKHVRVTNANMEPVFFTYPANPKVDAIVSGYVKNHAPEYDFVSVDGIGHHFWVIWEEEINRQLIGLFADIPYVYVADGHHRTAAAALVGNEKKQANPAHNGS